MNILAIESSCDETAVAVVRDGRTVLADCIASQVALHKIYGGVVPEIASRKHIEAISALADEAIAKADVAKTALDAVAVTYAPGLIGGGEFCQGRGAGTGPAADSGASYPGAYCGQLSGVSGAGAAVFVPRRLWRAYDAGGCAGFYEDENSGRLPG